MESSRTFHAEYRRLEQRMKALAEAEGDVFLPSSEPRGLADFVLIGMEPSFGPWARSHADARSKVEAGFRNFLSSFEDFILHFCARRYLCAPAQRYHITDLSKGAMLVDRAGLARYSRYDRWFKLLEEEIDLVSRQNTHFIAVGSAVAAYLARAGFTRPFTQIIHYSRQAANARKEAATRDRKGFTSFVGSVSLSDITETAGAVLREADVPDGLREQTLARLRKGRLSESRLHLIFSYKAAFESIPGSTSRRWP
jgi:hypothetical protein